jgi:hypothetical protein
MGIDKSVIVKCEEAIKNRLGTLRDLPYELANVVANIYYRYFELYGDGLPDYKTFTSLKDIPEKVHPADFMLQKATSYRTVGPQLNAINETIDKLRESDLKGMNPEMYNHAVEVIVDFIKYGIENADQKSLMRRNLERKFKKKRVNEIPNLIDFLDI